MGNHRQFKNPSLELGAHCSREKGICRCIFNAVVPMMPYSCGYFQVTKDFVHSDCLCTLLQCLEDVEEDANVFILQRKEHYIISPLHSPILVKKSPR